MVLKAYFDASHRNSRTFCIAGYAFTKGQVKKFDQEWWNLFGEYGGCHMTDLNAKQEGFKGIDKEEADRLIRGAVSIINRRVAFGVVISCDLAELDPLLPKWVRGFEGAFPVCCHIVMQRLGSFIAEAGNQRIAYFFETGDQYETAAHDFLKLMASEPRVKDVYRHASHNFIAKTEALALQAADVLAWEWAKYMDDKRERPERRMRKSLAALMTKNGQINSKQYIGHHVTGDPLRRWAENTERIVLQQIDEQAMQRAADQLRRDFGEQ